MADFNLQSLLRFVRDELSEEEEGLLMSAMGDDPDLQKEVDALLHLRDNFDNIVDNWTAAGHGRDLRNLRVLRLLESAVEANPTIAKITELWTHQLNQGGGYAFTSFIDAGNRLSGVGGYSLPGECETSVPWQGVASADAGELQEHLSEAGQCCEKLEFDSARSHVKQVGKIDARLAETAELEVIYDGQLVSRISVSSHRREVLVIYYLPPREAAPESATLLPLGKNAASPMIAGFVPDGDTELLAEFTEVPECEFIILF